MTPYSDLRERLDRGETVVLDGATGTELVRRGIRWRGNGLRTDAATVQQIHEEYLAAGADVIRTDTFQLNKRTFLNVFRNPAHMRHIGAPGLEHRAEELIAKAVEVARAARDGAGRSATVAGVMSPLEHCFRPDLTPPADELGAEHGEIAALLAGAGVDLLLLESMNTIAEATAAARAARVTGLPVWCSFVVGADGNVLSGESLGDAARAVAVAGVDAVLVNCAPPDDVTKALPALAGAGLAYGAYPHIGRFDPPSWKFEFFPQFAESETWPPERFAAAVRDWQSQGARIVGGCCGTTPEHIRALKGALVGAL